MTHLPCRPPPLETGSIPRRRASRNPFSDPFRSKDPPYRQTEDALSPDSCYEDPDARFLGPGVLFCRVRFSVSSDTCRWILGRCVHGGGSVVCVWRGARLSARRSHPHTCPPDPSIVNPKSRAPDRVTFAPAPGGVPARPPVRAVGQHRHGHPRGPVQHQPHRAPPKPSQGYNQFFFALKCTRGLSLKNECAPASTYVLVFHPLISEKPAAWSLLEKTHGKVWGSPQPGLFFKNSPPRGVGGGEGGGHHRWRRG